ncbi:AMP-binding protein [Cyanobium sp. HWJ4-Hawea]|uniref:AMP-binding protein n=1 Tax=Cyanobium sp. HWJ4-Hawea TaxID=2823713 RepID=UPI0020CEBEB2|nr:AMP-binding protein [Cyanobium sp. HWJ4-Hawea]MCP9809450.1 AMP-binding protein [Cyanobium sp. HWJ4-Hawea]
MIEHWQQLWAHSQRHHGQRPALLAPEGELSFSQLGQQADQWRHFYESQPHWQVGRCVALPWRNPWSDLPQLVGLWLAGGVWIAHAHDSCHAALAQELEAGIQGPAVGPGRWCTILFSSGSTGPPKLFVRGWRQALLEAQANAAKLNLAAGSPCAMLVNPWFGASSKHLLAGFLQGWCQVIGRSSLALLPGDGELLYATPSQLQALGAAPEASPRFAWISLTGEACPLSLWPLLQTWAQPGGQCLNALGATETGVVAEQVLPLSAPWQGFRGVPFDGKDVAVVGDQGQVLLDAGAIGRLQIRGEALIEGQLLKAQQRWQLEPTPSRAGLMGVLSNDLARWNEKGELELLGRSNQLLKRHGEWLDVTPLQQALEQQPGVQRCLLLCDPDGLNAWLQLDQPSQSLLGQIAAALTGALDDPRLHPQRLFGVAKFPLNANGKIDIPQLQAGPCPGERVFSVDVEPAGKRLELQPSLDSLDQAQLVSKLQSTNLLWCGAIPAALEQSFPADVGLMALGFPRHQDPTSSSSQRRNFKQLASDLADLVLQIAGNHLGEDLWLGGFSLAAWLAYALALELESRQVGVRGVFMVDPIDPFHPLYRLRWHRGLRSWWRKGYGSWRHGDVGKQRAIHRSIRQELIGEWILQEPPRPIQGSMVVYGGAWIRSLSRRHAQRFKAEPQWCDLLTDRHADVVSKPELTKLWVPKLLDTIKAS